MTNIRNDISLVLLGVTGVFRENTRQKQLKQLNAVKQGTD
jgi:hypothetical protein